MLGVLGVVSAIAFHTVSVPCRVHVGRAMMCEAITGPAPLEVLSLDLREDGWNDVRQEIRDRQKPWAALKTKLAPVGRGWRSSKNVGRTLLSRDFWTTWPTPEPLPSKQLEQVTPNVPCEPVPLTANTIFTMEDRADGWNDVRDAITRAQPAIAGIDLAARLATTTAVWAQKWAKLRAFELCIVLIAGTAAIGNLIEIVAANLAATSSSSRAPEPKPVRVTA